MKEYTLITGACGGLGGAFVQLLAERGEPLFLTGRSEPRLTALSQSLKERFPSLPVQICACDLTDEHSRANMFARSNAQGIRFRRLVYVAGADIQKAFEKYTQEKILFQTRVNFEGAVSCIKFALENGAQNRKTEILAVGSVSGIYPMPYFALYSATKKALNQFCAALRAEYRGRANITCVLPGAIPTRADVKENIRAQGLWGRLAAKSPLSVAKASLKAVQRNRRTVIIGFWNKLMRVCTACIPLSFKLRAIARRWSKTEKDAFS